MLCSLMFESKNILCIVPSVHGLGRCRGGSIYSHGCALDARQVEGGKRSDGAAAREV